MKAHITKLILVSFLIISFSSCSPIKHLFKSNDIKITLKKNYNTWTIEDCNSIIRHYTRNNKISDLLGNEEKPQIFISVQPLNKNVILALIRKEAIQKRYNQKQYIRKLKDYLESYTNYTLDTLSTAISKKKGNSINGYSFRIYMENNTEPFRHIFLEDGYSYFFLENKQGKFSRVTEVTGLYAEDDIQLDGYLNVIVTFSVYATDGTLLFNKKNWNEYFRLVFNALQTKPIVIEWEKND